MNSDVAISVEHLSKRYLIGGKQRQWTIRDSIDEFLHHPFGIGAERHDKEEFWALNDVSFEIRKGDVVGIIGRNGSGKSTLLKILARIVEPTEGKVTMYGRVASLLEVGTGFNPDLTGRENIFLNGSILGMSQKEIAGKFDEIVAFSGVEQFIDTPVKRYSSGMYVRLAFAVAAHLDSDILLVDEVLAVGDAEFQKKCLGKMKSLAGGGKTVLFVSHDMSAISSLCSTVIWLEKGKVKLEGKPFSTIKWYLTNDDGKSHEGVSITCSQQNGTPWKKGEFVEIQISWSKDKFSSISGCDLAAYDQQGMKIFACESDKLMHNQTDFISGFKFFIKNIGYSEKYFSIDCGLKTRNSDQYQLLLTNILQLIPDYSTLPEYRRRDVITTPEMKCEYV